MTTIACHHFNIVTCNSGQRYRTQCWSTLWPLLHVTISTLWIVFFFFTSWVKGKHVYRTFVWYQINIAITRVWFWAQSSVNDLIRNDRFNLKPVMWLIDFSLMRSLKARIFHGQRSLIAFISITVGMSFRIYREIWRKTVMILLNDVIKTSLLSRFP